MVPTAPVCNRVSVRIQVACFGLIGVSTVALDFTLLYLLVKVFDANYFVSTFLAFTADSTVNYLLSVRYVFLTGRFGKAQEFTIFMVTTESGWA
jgi:putative flippase GtrA